MQQKWVLLQSVKGELSAGWSLVLPSALRKPAQYYLETRSRSNVNGALSILRHKCDKTCFSVRPHDFLHPSPINSALYVVVMFVLVCLRRFLWQILLLTYTSYKLDAHIDLSRLRSISGWFLNFKSLFSNSLPSANLNKFSEYCIN